MIDESTVNELETRIGSRWLLYGGGVAIVVGVACFEKLAFDNHWINETMRVVQGGAIGLVLVGAGLRIARKGYGLYGQIVCGCGIAILYVSTYAAFNFYHLIGRGIAFALMSVVTMMAAWLADRHRSQGLAIVAVFGGFATPFLLPTTVDTEVSLFTYDAILIGGTLVLSRRREWPALNVGSYAFTIVTFLGWAVQFYADSKYGVTEGFLTLFCAMFLFILRERPLRWTTPLGYYLLSLAILWDHSGALLTYLVALSLVGVLVARRFGSGIRVAFWFAAAAPLLAWTFDLRDTHRWMSAGLAAWTAIYVMNLVAMSEAILVRGERLTGFAITLLDLNALVAFDAAYRLIDPQYPNASAPLAAALALLNGGLAAGLWRDFRDEALHLAALAFTFVTIAIALQFHGLWITAGWAAEGAVIAWLGLRERREWLRVGGLALLAIAIIRLLVSQLAQPITEPILMLNRRGLCGLFVIALLYWLATIDRQLSRVFVISANILTLLLLTSEIEARSSMSRFAQELTISITWGVYAAGLVVVGLKKQYAPIRYLAMIVFGITTFKVFAVDLSELDRIYRVLSAIVLGVTLLATSYLYQKQSHPDSSVAG